MRLKAHNDYVLLPKKNNTNIMWQYVEEWGQRANWPCHCLVKTKQAEFCEPQPEVVPGQWWGNVMSSHMVNVARLEGFMPKRVIQILFDRLKKKEVGQKKNVFWFGISRAVYQSAFTPSKSKPSPFLSHWTTEPLRITGWLLKQVRASYHCHTHATIITLSANKLQVWPRIFRLV